MARLIVMDWQRVLLFRDGTLDKVLSPGRHRYNPRRHKLVKVDTRPTMMDIPGQEVITGDGVSVRVSFAVLWRVTDPVAFTVEAQAPTRVLYAATQDAVRTRVARIDLDTALSDRETLSQGLADGVMETVSGLGIAIDELRLRDLMLPGELRRAAMDVVIARHRGKAALEEARAEAAALRSLKNTAALLEQHPSLLQLRTLQVAAQDDTSLVLDPRGPATDRAAGS